MAEPPAQPLDGVVVLGMHRSGTSLVTRLLSMAGLSLCRTGDLILGLRANPRGHWESRSMMNLNDRLLIESGGAWFCPPLLREPELGTLLERRGEEAVRALDDAHPDRPFVWKDPRTSVLLPFWAKALEGRVAYLLVTRHPLEVSDSLQSRNGFAPALGLALWERYTRESLLGAAGRPLMSCTYDSVLAAPADWLADVRAFLASVGVEVTGDRGLAEAAAEAFVSPGLRHGRRSWEELGGEPLLTGEQAALAAALAGRRASASFEPGELPPESPSTEPIFAELRGRVRETGSPALEEASVPARLRVPAAPPERSRPPISLVHLGPRAPSAELTADLPDGSEVIVVGTAPPGAPDSAGGRLVVRTLGAGAGEGAVAALDAGLDDARGETVVLSAGEAVPTGSWCRPLEAALERWQVAGVSPAFAPAGGREGPGLGRVFTTPVLDSDALAGAAGAEPVPVPLLAAELAAFDRRVIQAAGGLDRGFTTVRAAIEELSVRLWRMGFRCTVAPGAEFRTHAADGAGGDGAAVPRGDRVRTASLHFDPGAGDMLRAREVDPSFADAVLAEREELRTRRITIDALCPLTIADYVGDFTGPLMPRRRSPPGGGRRPPLRRLARLLRGALPGR